jgi:hypothetical protein
MRRAARTHEVLVDAADRGVPRGDVGTERTSASTSEAGDVLVEPSPVDEALLHDRRGDHRREQPGVAARAHLQVEVGELGGLGAARVDDDHRPRRVAAISLSVVRACGMPWLCHGFLPTNTATSACSKSPRTIVAEHPAVHPELAGLLLRERA